MSTEAERESGQEQLGTGAVARELGVLEWQIVAAIKRGFVDEPPRFGRWRAWRRADLPRVREGLVRAGFLLSPAECAAADASRRAAAGIAPQDQPTTF